MNQTPRSFAEVGMAEPSGRTTRHSWGGSLRLRLTVAFSLLFLAAGVMVLLGVMILVRNSMTYSLDLAFGRSWTPDGRGVPQDWPLGEPGLAESRAYENTATKDFILSSMLDNLFYKVALAVLAVWLLATLAGWFLSGRILRPLSAITATAQQIAGRSLHQRIALDLPPGEVKSLADSFDSMLDRIDEAFAGQGRFIANAAHELKTPLALNRTLVEVAMNRPGSPPELTDLGGKLLTVNLRHERLIDALLTLARSEETLTVKRPVDLAALGAGVGDLAEAFAREQQVVIRRTLSPALTVGDPILLEQLIRNLLDNAIRYNRPGGWAELVTGGRGRYTEIIVSNTGTAIAPFEVPALFEPFHRLIDRVGSARGSGLGLSIVRAVAQAHRGDVVAEPRPGGGLVVRVVLPNVRVPHPLDAAGGPDAVMSVPVAGE